MPALPCLSRLLSRADRERRLRETSQPPASHSQAAYAYFSDFGVWPQGPVLLAEPVHLRADQRYVRLYGCDVFTLALAEAEELVSSLNALIAADGLRFELANANRWYLHYPDSLQISTMPLITVLGKAMDDYLPEGRDAATWHAWMNEWQMLLFNHPVNRQRGADKALPVNGVWLWGEASPEACSIQAEKLYTADPVAMGMAMAEGCRVNAVPDSMNDIDVTGNGAIRILLDQLRRHVAYQDQERYAQALLQLESQWLEPLMQSVSSGEVGRLILTTQTRSKEFRFAWSGKHRWRLWRKERPISDWLEHD